MKINKMITPYNHREGSIDRIKYIVIHFVGATSGAEANCKYFMSDGRNASAHYFVDFDGSVWQSVEDKDIAWHCGGKNPTCNNNNSIGIEMCVRNKGSQANNSSDWYFEDATVASTVQLTKELMEKYNVPPTNVWRHYDVTQKICPNPYVLNKGKHTWTNFQNAIQAKALYEPNKWFQDSRGWWYTKSDMDYARNEWQTINHHRYYFNEKGYAVSGQQTINGVNYYFATKEINPKLECALMGVVEV